uniref:Deoxyribonuclease II n=2 Tax=Macrostomum lignano TaxID=282301 RepID=A0A1I8GCS4_9PLAT
MNYKFVLSLSAWLVHAASAEFQCLDADGFPLDWFALLKQPHSGHYAYVSSNSSTAWIQPDGCDITRDGPVFSTVSQVLQAGSNAAADVLAAYNDEPPEDNNSSSIGSSAFGHMKGLVALKSGQKGFWLIHSVPKFPNMSLHRYEYPDTGMKYGQSFLCLTVDSAKMANIIGSQLFVSHPDLYSLSVSPAAEAAWPSWADLKKRKQPPKALMNSTVKLVTSGGLSVMHLAKSPHLKQDLYSYLLAGQLQSNIQVETWQHGKELLNSTCNRRYNVTKVLDVRIGNQTQFKSTKDHSKWCVTAQTDAKPHTCIGDMNRAETQYHRGGGIACIGLVGLHRLFKAAVIHDQPCGSAGHAKSDKELLLSLYNWVMLAAVCAMACIVLLLVLLLTMALAKLRSRQQKVLSGSGSSGQKYRIL